ncbi:hypothetical protein TIFTF001_042363 [Ficus carica]|uniref:Uncharacterized protein n=1 Tax=Ficus carica TaxID=3494 RepID=A0AA87ZMB8_FICCA|nr:hypothetical protein TIFTF001_042363 [Ficus carica]
MLLAGIEFPHTLRTFLLFYIPQKLLALASERRPAWISISLEPNTFHVPVPSNQGKQTAQRTVRSGDPVISRDRDAKH